MTSIVFIFGLNLLMTVDIPVWLNIDIVDQVVKKRTVRTQSKEERSDTQRKLNNTII